MRAKRRNAGRPLPETAEMKVWRDEYDHLSTDEHKAKLKELGLGDTDFSEFNEVLKKEKKK